MNAVAAANSAIDRAEQRWAKRGQNPIARYQSWVSLHAPWAWRVRLDLILIFNALLALVGFGAAFLFDDVLKIEYRSNIAAWIWLVMALASSGAAFYWAYAVTKVVRLRGVSRFGAEPDPISGFIACASFALWAAVAGALPYVSVDRTLTYGQAEEGYPTDAAYPVEAVPYAEPYPADAPAAPVDPNAPPPPSPAEVEAAANVLRLENEALAARSRPADVWRVLFSKPAEISPLMNDDGFLSAMREYARTHEPWNDRPRLYYDQRQLRDWMFEEGLLDAFRETAGYDAAVLAMFKRTEVYNWQNQFSWIYNNYPYTPDYYAESQPWREILTSPLYRRIKGDAHAAEIETALMGGFDAWIADATAGVAPPATPAPVPETPAPAPPALDFAAPAVPADAAAAGAYDYGPYYRYERIVDALSAYAAQTPRWAAEIAPVQALGNTAYTPEATAAARQQLRAFVANPELRADFRASPNFEGFMATEVIGPAVLNNEFDAAVAASPAYHDFLRKAQETPLDNLPEQQLLDELQNNWAAIAIAAALLAALLAVFVSAVNRGGLGAALIAVVIAAIISAVAFFTAFAVNAALSLNPQYTDTPVDAVGAAAAQARAEAREFWQKVLLLGAPMFVSIVLPLAWTARDFFTGVQRRRTRFVAFAAVWASAFWFFVLTVSESDAWYGANVIADWAPNRVLGGAIWLLGLAVLVFGIAKLVHFMLTRISSYPRPA